MNPQLTRRELLKLVGLGGATGVATGSGAVAPTTRRGGRGGRNQRTVVLVRLLGGNDHLDMIVPNSAAYHDLRGALARPENTLSILDDEFSVPVGLGTVSQLWGDRRVATVHGIHAGTHAGTLTGAASGSHSSCIGRWATLSDNPSTSDGWVSRLLSTGIWADEPLPAVVLGTPSEMCTGSELAIPTVPVDLSELANSAEDRADWASWNDALASLPPGAGPSNAVAESMGRMLGLAPVLESTGSGGGAPPTRTVEPSTGLGRAMRLVARLIRSPQPPRVIHVTHGGDFDVHHNSLQRRDPLMAELDEGLAVLLDGLNQDLHAVVIATYSEFGRRPRANASGVDHGTASTHLLLGEVNPGHHGAPPRFDRLDADGNLIPTVDARSWAAELITWLGGDPAEVVGPTGTLGVLR